MKRTLLILTLWFALGGAQAAARTRPSRAELARTVAALAARTDSLRSALAALQEQSVPVSKGVDPTWERWQDVRYSYGMDPAEQPVYNTVDGVLESTTMLSVRGGRGRWHNGNPRIRTTFADGGHLFEGWNGSESCRLTLLIGKQAPDIACIQVYSPRGLYRPARHFGWVKLGSDDSCEGVDFGRRWAVSFVPFTLAGLDEAPAGIGYENVQLTGTEVPAGTLYFDRTTGTVRCFTGDTWRSLSYE